MLRVGLTGGIGAGKSTVARRLVELGATLVDADRVAREVVLPGTEGLAGVVEAFGERVLDAEGGLNRPALAEIVFGDEASRKRLNGILHPLIGRRTAELIAAAPADGVLVQDVPLLVEGAMQSAFALVMVVDAAEDIRVARLISDRGMTEEAARARIAAQADEPARRAAADVWLDNSGPPGDVLAQVDRLWAERLVPFEAAIRSGAPARPPAAVVQADPGWPEQYERLAARLRRAVPDVGPPSGPDPASGPGVTVDHVGPTAVAGLPAPDVIDIQLGLPDLGDLDAALPALREVGFLPGAADPMPLWPEGPAGSVLLSADPGRPARVWVRVTGATEHRTALLLRDWMRAEPQGRTEYSAATGRCHKDHADQAEHPDSGPGWAGISLDQANRWAMRSGWRAPAGGPGTDPTQKV
jgi:dephospho-CoA kinase